MTLLEEAVEAKRFDVRVVERNVQRGFVKPEEAEKSIKALSDDTDNAEWVKIEDLADDPESAASRQQ